MHGPGERWSGPPRPRRHPRRSARLPMRFSWGRVPARMPGPWGQPAGSASCDLQILPIFRRVSAACGRPKLVVGRKDHLLDSSRAGSFLSTNRLSNPPSGPALGAILGAPLTPVGNSTQTPTRATTAIDQPSRPPKEPLLPKLRLCVFLFSFFFCLPPAGLCPKTRFTLPERLRACQCTIQIWSWWENRCPTTPKEMALQLQQQNLPGIWMIVETDRIGPSSSAQNSPFRHGRRRGDLRCRLSLGAAAVGNPFTNCRGPELGRLNQSGHHRFRWPRCCPQLDNRHSPQWLPGFLPMCGQPCRIVS